MGWDAYSFKPGARHWPESRREPVPVAYQEACDRVVAETGCADRLLADGGLDVSTCAYMLREAVGESVWAEDDWEPEKVRRLNARANWDFEIDPDKAWAKASARAFLETTAALGRGVWFSW
jgi:hypothetical protein